MSLQEKEEMVLLTLGEKSMFQKGGLTAVMEERGEM
jgi:hypothetical protein